MSRRLYLGRLPPDTRTEDVNDLFKGYGRIVDCRVMTGSSNKRRGNDSELNDSAPPGFGFVEFESSKDAEDAVNNFNGKQFMGSTIAVEFAKESRPRREPYEERGGGGYGYDD
jgi:arginine/serine-rich splicing factor 4/5/6